MIALHVVPFARHLPALHGDVLRLTCERIAHRAGAQDALREEPDVGHDMNPVFRRGVLVHHRRHHRQRDQQRVVGCQTAVHVGPDDVELARHHQIAHAVGRVVRIDHRVEGIEHLGQDLDRRVAERKAGAAHAGDGAQRVHPQFAHRCKDAVDQRYDAHDDQADQRSGEHCQHDDIDRGRDRFGQRAVELRAEGGYVVADHAIDEEAPGHAHGDGRADEAGCLGGTARLGAELSQRRFARQPGVHRLQRSHRLRGLNNRGNYPQIQDERENDRL